MEMEKEDDPAVWDHWIINLFLFPHQILDPNTTLMYLSSPSHLRNWEERKRREVLVIKMLHINSKEQ